MALENGAAEMVPPLPAVFLVSLGGMAMEIALTRYFAVATWSEYGYWVISIVLAGFAFSGVALAVAQQFFLRHGPRILAILPPMLVLTAAGGTWLATINPFNPLQLQNAATLTEQLGNIALYYAAFLPFFTFTGLFIGLCFTASPSLTSRIYGTDLIGAGAGALLVLLLMFLVAPFRLVPCLLVPIALSGAFMAPRLPLIAACLVALLIGEAGLLGFDRAAINEYKAIFAPMHVPNSKVLAVRPRPSGLYMLLDDFTERLDTDVSNNASSLGLRDPPSSWGLYRDGNRIAALPKAAIDTGYAGATLAALPYALLSHPRVLVAGASGGFRIAEAQALGAAAIDASEPEPVLLSALRRGLAPAPKLPLATTTTLTADPPLTLARTPNRYDLVDISADFADSAEANATSFATESLAADIEAVKPAGLVSIPVSIREFPAYATRMLATARAALLRAGITDPLTHAIVYRSAWNVRILLSPAPFDPARIHAARAWCDARSFDVSYYPGIDVAAARAGIYNDLPAVSFESAEVTSNEGLHDAVADEAGPVLAGQTPPSAHSFDLSPITLDRPSLNAVLRLARLDTILQRLEVLPQGEVGPLVNLAVLAQAIIIAALVLAVPLLAARTRQGGADLARAALFFPALGLGFLMIEIAAIEAASLLLTDRTLAFALVMTSMLIFSGLGAMLAGTLHSKYAMPLAAAAVIAWCALMLILLPGALIPALSFGLAPRIALVLLAMAPVSVALGMPFPLGLSRLGSGAALPWAWGLNGAFSVVATPLANLIATKAGHSWLLFLAILLYALAIVSFPKWRAA